MGHKVKLYGFTGSNSVYTGRLMLEHKGVDYNFVKLPPAAHAPMMLMMGFDTMAVPAIKVDGVRVQGTRWISRALDEMYPDKPLFPADREARRASSTPASTTRRSPRCCGRSAPDRGGRAIGPPDSPLGADRWAIVTLALANGLALERLIDPAGVPGD